jgi:fumarylacetoacetase
MIVLDETHDPALKTWVDGADGHGDFPIQNLPFGIFSPKDQAPRGGVAIGDFILDLAGLAESGLLAGDAARAAQHAAGATLNPLFSLGAASRRALRKRLSELLSSAEHRATIEKLLCLSADCTMHLPAAIGDYTDFYAGIHHALNIGKQFRPDAPLLPNYKHIPIGYHGRASSVRPSGTPVRRPNGQTRVAGKAPAFGPCKRLDYELELGVWIGPGNRPGEAIPVAEAADHIAGFCLLNDWSARDIQAWEYQPLGPFLAKNFATTISCWVVTPEALAPFRVAQPPRPEGDPLPLDYLFDENDQAQGAFSLTLDIAVRTQKTREHAMQPHKLAATNTSHLYWTVAQLLSHHASGGCDMRPGDLLGTGTISGPDPDSHGSLMEATLNGAAPITLPTGETRAFLEDGDEVFFHARASRPGFASIGFGECRAVIQPSFTNLPTR